MRLFKDEHGDTMISGLVAVAIGVCVLIAVFAIIPLIGSEIEGAVTLGADSDWNASHNTDLDSPVTIWEKTSNLIILAAIVSILALVIGAIMMMQRIT